MKKVKLLAACLLALSLSATAVVASAAIKKTQTPLFSTSGVINEVDWTFKGDTASTTFKSNMKGDVAELPVLAWGGAVGLIRGLAYPLPKNSLQLWNLTLLNYQILHSVLGSVQAFSPL